MTLKRWQRTHVDMVYLSNKWHREAKDVEGDRGVVLESCAARVQAVVLRDPRLRWVKGHLRSLARSFMDESNEYPYRSARAAQLIECAHILEIRSL